MKKLSLFLMLTMLALVSNSCSKEESKENLGGESILNTTTLKIIHNSISQSFKNSSSTNKIHNKLDISQKSSYTQPFGNEEEVSLETLSFQDEYTISVFDTNYGYVQSNGLENLFAQYGLNEEIINMADWALDNINDENLYENLLMTFSIANEQDAHLLFYFVELYEEFDIDQSALSGCGRAIIGTILVTAVFAGVTAATGGFGGAAAAGFLVSKGWSIYNVIAACSSQVKVEYFVPTLDEVVIDINDPFNLGSNSIIPIP
ncbi:hypothetical protein [Hyunsoonleella rubra]|uniref:Uncharacterized protein n=1 Tax=Hyunsoonleella rubra TaxID=1737062 RepID=A0ABW5T6H5_9FLAO